MTLTRPLRGASFSVAVVVVAVAVHAAGCGGRDDATSSGPDASDADGNSGSNDAGNKVGDDAGNPRGDDSGSDAGISPWSDGGGPATFPLGAYGDCALSTFLQTPGGGGATGSGGSVTLAQSGSELSVSYSGGDGGVPLAATFKLTQTSGLSATLDPGQEVDGVQLACAPLDFASTVVQLGSGALTYNGGTLFLSVVGTAEAVDAGGGCSNPGGPAAFAIACSEQPASPIFAAGIDAGSSDAGLASDFVGVYSSCTSSMQVTSSSLEGAFGGGKGTLTITQTGGVLTAAYANDLFDQGSLEFLATTDSAALPATANETMQVLLDCNGQTPPPPNPQMIALPVMGSSLTIDGSSVVLSFVGTLPAGLPGGCSGAATEVAVICSK